MTQPTSWALTPAALVYTLTLGLYVLGGELLWIGRKGLARLAGAGHRGTNGFTYGDKLQTWRRRQIETRKKIFSLQ